MSHHIDDSGWPLLLLRQEGRMTIEDASALTDALATAIDRAAADGAGFAAVFDFVRRGAPVKGANEISGTFFTENATRLAAACTAMASVVADEKLVAAGRSGGLPGLNTLTTLDRQQALDWARHHLGVPAVDSGAHMVHGSAWTSTSSDHPR